jgi:hypothetical protein
MKTAKKPTGYILYRGKSELNGKPIVVVAITKSTNSKTGNMIQTYILADNGLSPVESAKTLEDAAICGDCKHRRGLGGSCYVNLGQGPRAVMDGVKRAIYPSDAKQAAIECTGRKVRLGTYGDPAAVPFHIWEILLKNAAGNTGYTHQWRKFKSAKSLKLMSLVMASADSEKDRIDALIKGFRTFRVKTSDEPILPGEFPCPASKEQGKKLQCEDCMACDGGISRKGSPVIVVHGSLASRFIN